MDCYSAAEASEGDMSYDDDIYYKCAEEQAAMEFEAAMECRVRDLIGIPDEDDDEGDPHLTDEEVLEKFGNFCDILPAAAKQAKKLFYLLGFGRERSPPSILVHGLPSTGKSYIVNGVLKNNATLHVTVNCVECYMPRLIFEPILHRLRGIKLTPEDGYKRPIHCDDLCTFVRLMKYGPDNEKWKDRKIVIVLDRAERLRTMGDNLLPGFLRLQEFTGLNICVILISVLPWDDYLTATSVDEPFPLFFPQYNKEEMVEILAQNVPDDCDKQVYTAYLKLIVNVYSSSCRNLCDLRYIAKENFEKYREPIDKDEADWTETRKLWRNIEPHLKQSLQSVLLHDHSSTSGTAHGRGQTGLELPFDAKFLLIAAYLASYNPKSTDKRNFVKNHGKQRKPKVQRKLKYVKMTSHLLGPKAFPLDRLLAIFHAISSENTTNTSSIFSHVSTLVSLNLLSQMKSSDMLDTPRYKCIVGFDFVKEIARTVDFDIAGYLFAD